jgi:MFS family permease
MGGGYSLLAASLWPMISLTTPISRQGTAFGITQAIQNLGLGLGAKLVGYITDNFGYYWVEIFFVLSLAIAILACLALAMLNHQGKNKKDFHPVVTKVIGYVAHKFSTKS